MDVNWSDPRVVSLHERVATAVQREYRDSITPTGSLADPEHLGARVAAALLAAATDISFGRAEWSLAFAADPKPSRTLVEGCLTCGAGVGAQHTRDCHRTGVMRRLRDGEAQL